MIQGVTAAGMYAGQARAAGSTVKTASAGFSDLLHTAAEKNNKSKTQNLDEIFDEAASKYGVSVKLLKAVAKAESGFQTDAVSRCGAQGIMQLMPSTAASLGVQDSFDAEQNIMGGAKYLSGLISTFGGNTKFAVAAYNAGSGSVRKYGGVPPYRETQNYVRKVMSYAGEDSSAEGWQALAGTGSYGISSVGGSSESTGLGDLAFSEDDYSLFAKMFVQKLEQDALNNGVAEAEETGSREIGETSA